MPKKLMVIDGNSIINRAFYGVHALSTRDGIPTNAVYGFLTILMKLLEGERPDALCVTFDLKAPTFRHLSYEGYKAGRRPMPEELVSQVPLLKEVLDAMNIMRCELSGWEADDLIGTIAAVDAAAGWDTTIVTGDKDSLQLITDRTTVKLITTRLGQTTEKDMTPAAFFETYGFTPEKMVDLKALMGDASDNIPGVPGVGEKTAMDLIQRFGTVEEIYQKWPDLDGVKPGALKKLDEGRDSAKMSFDLATIHCDAPIAFAPEDALRRPVDEAALYPLFLKLEFAKLIDKLGLKAPQGDAPAAEQTFSGAVSSEVVETQARLDELLTAYQKAEKVSVAATPDLFAVAVGYWPAENQQHTALFRSDRLEGYDAFLGVLFSGGVKKAGHSVKDLMNALLDQGLSTDGFVFDVAVAAYLLAPTDGSYDLDKLGMTYFHTEYPKAKDYAAPDVFGPLADLGSTQAAEQALLAHALLIACLADELDGRLTELGMRALYDTVDLPLCPVLARMERAGVLVDRKALSEYGVMLDAQLKTDEAEIYELAGETFNINSPKQLGVILFEKLGLPSLKKTKTGHSTNAEVLEKLRGAHPIVELILEYRQYAKLKSTYVDGLSKVIGPDGRVRTSFQNTVTATGRLSSTEPNLQNIPVRTELGAKLRYMFVARPGWVLVDADYAQIELRILAQMAGDETMRQAFLSGADIHAATASQVFGVPVEEVTHEERRRAKAVNFGIVYGISDFSLSQDIHVTRKEAREYIDRYLATFHGVRDYMARVVEQAKENGYVSTLMGRRRWLPELKSSNHNMRAFGERVALNMPIQGTAADVIKLAMIRVSDAIRAAGLRAELVLQVHDELIVECPEEEAERVKALLTSEMEHVVDWPVPMKADSAAGKSWGEAKA